MSCIALVDYGMGNLHSARKALEHAGGRVELVSTPEALLQAERIVLPGVGAFRDCMAALKADGMDEALLTRLQQGVPFLGICLGMQVLLDVSQEFGQFQGLGHIPGSVKPLPEGLPSLGYKIPHMGWNDLAFAKDREVHPVLEPLVGEQVYFVHSYYCAPENPAHMLAACSYGSFPFAAAIGLDHVVAVQFHPEKSQRAGLAMLERFVHWMPD